MSETIINFKNEEQKSEENIGQQIGGDRSKEGSSEVSRQRQKEPKRDI